MKKEAMSLKETLKEYMGWFREEKEKRETELQC